MRSRELCGSCSQMSPLYHREDLPVDGGHSTLGPDAGQPIQGESESPDTAAFES